MSAMSAAAAAPAASLAARSRYASLGKSSAAPRATRPVRGAPLRCNAFLDKLKEAADAVTTGIKGDPATKTQARYQARVDAINAIGPAMTKLSDDELRAKTAELQAKVRGGADLDPPGGSSRWIREAADRVLGLRPFDVQLIGGMILHEGSIAEMRTGEERRWCLPSPRSSTRSAGRACTS